MPHPSTNVHKHWASLSFTLGTDRQINTAQETTSSAQVKIKRIRVWFWCYRKLQGGTFLRPRWGHFYTTAALRDIIVLKSLSHLPLFNVKQRELRPDYRSTLTQTQGALRTHYVLADPPCVHRKGLTAPPINCDRASLTKTRPRTKTGSRLRWSTVFASMWKP